MKTTFLHQTGEDRLLVFFNGWSRDAHSAPRLDAGGFDVLEVSDYTTPDSDLKEKLRPYSRIHLAAWSLGVWAAARAFRELPVRLESALAINGTLRPVDAAFGIAPDIFAGTIENWDDESARSRFLRRMAGSAAELTALPVPDRTPESQKNELAALQEAILAESSLPALFTRAVIGSRDRIFPASAQKAFWEAEGVPFAELDLPHYPFAGLSAWPEVTDLGKS